MGGLSLAEDTRNMAEQYVTELYKKLKSRDSKTSGLLDILDVLIQVQKNLSTVKNPEALVNRCIQYIRSVAIKDKLYFPPAEENIIINLEVIGQKAGWNGSYMADFSDKSQFYKLSESIPHH